MEVAKLIIKQFLPKLGFSADEIPVGNGQRADLRIADDKDVYHIEVKEKYDSEEDVRKRRDALATGDVYPEVAPLWKNNTISGILRDAQGQLDETPKDPGTFQLIWFHAGGIDAELKGMQAFATFYGDVPVSARWPSEAGTKHCFYFDYSDAVVMPTIEALILSERDSLARVCLNERSPRAAEFRETKLFQKFHALNVVFDPLELASAGEVIFCRATIPRKNDDVVAKALHEQTGVLYSAIRMNRYTQTVAVNPYLDAQKRNSPDADSADGA